MFLKRKTADQQPSPKTVRYALPAWSFRLSRQARRAA